jgi:hypothetical protein
VQRQPEVLNEEEEKIQAETDTDERDEHIQTKSEQNTTKPMIQRRPELEKDEEAEEEKEEESVEAQRLSNQSTPITDEVQNKIQSLKGTGQPLPKSERNYFEPRFGRDFSHVRIHNDLAAASLARSLNAKAFTICNHIAFNHGEFTPDTQAGKHLLAHELTHTIQQNNVSENRAHKTNEELIQREQLGGPATGQPHFTYRLDSAVRNIQQLATYYGISAPSIRQVNSGVSEDVGNVMQVPANNPPAAMGGVFGGTGLRGIVEVSDTADIRWNAHANSNLVGQLRSGENIPETFDGPGANFTAMFIDPSRLIDQAQGIVNEIRALGLVSGPASLGNYILVFIPAANVTRRTNRAQNALAVAVREHSSGVREQPECTNRGPDVDKYTGVTSGRCGRAWCAYFVRWCLNQAGISNRLTGGATSVATWQSDWFHNVPETRPIAGDIFLIPSASGPATHDCDTHACVTGRHGTGHHTGFVRSVSGDNIITIEGNVHIPGAVPQNDGILSRPLPISRLVGVLRIP